MKTKAIKRANARSGEKERDRATATVGTGIQHLGMDDVCEVNVTNVCCWSVCHCVIMCDDCCLLLVCERVVGWGKKKDEAPKK